MSRTSTAGALARVSLLLVIALFAGVLLGSEPLDLAALRAGDAVEQLIVQSRLWHVLLAAVTGAALGLAGASLQALVENPLADPYVLGLSGGAAVGASAAMGLGAFAVGPGACAGALLAGSIVLSLGRVEGRLVPERLLLVGVVVNTLCTALVLAVQSLVSPRTMQSLFGWLMGSVGDLSPGVVMTAGAIVLAVGGLLFREAHALDLLSLGEWEAHSLGLDVVRTRRRLLLLSALLVAAAVSLCGLVGFVGLLAPHVMRRAYGAQHRRLLPLSLLGGAIFLVIGDLGGRLFFRVARTLPPVGMVTALVGAPLLLRLLLRRSRA